MTGDDDETRRNIVNQLVGIVEEYASPELVTAVCGRGLNGWIDLSEQVARIGQILPIRQESPYTRPRSG